MKKRSAKDLLLFIYKLVGWDAIPAIIHLSATQRQCWDCIPAYGLFYGCSDYNQSSSHRYFRTLKMSFFMAFHSNPCSCL